MNQTGFLIAARRGADEFFTSTSAYDRPSWVPVAEATVYYSADAATQAQNKLIKRGSHNAVIVPVSEAMSFEFPNGEVVTPGEDEPPVEDESGMVADEHQDVCPECSHDPCTCEMGDEGDVSMTDEPSMMDDEEDITDETLPPIRMESEEPKKIEYNHPATDGEVDYGGDQHEDKISTPSSVMSDLNAAIAEFEKEVEKYDGHDNDTASFYMTAVDSFRTLKDHLQDGTALGIKNAQIEMTRWMSPIGNKLPASVRRFVESGGKKTTLSERFQELRQAKREQ